MKSGGAFLIYKNFFLIVLLGEFEDVLPTFRKLLLTSLLEIDGLSYILDEL